ncbi:hypothetical protein GCM10027610_095610 [Dactylosporangium cerinum]
MGPGELAVDEVDPLEGQPGQPGRGEVDLLESAAGDRHVLPHDPVEVEILQVGAAQPGVDEGGADGAAGLHVGVVEVAAPRRADRLELTLVDDREIDVEFMHGAQCHAPHRTHVG